MGQGEKVSGEQLSLGSAGDRSGALFHQIPFPERVKALDIFVLRVF
jgi:hypothetical protein